MCFHTTDAMHVVNHHLFSAPQTVEAAYNLVQETLMEGMAALKDECREATKQQSALMRSDMDQIINSRAFLESKLRGTTT